MNDKVQHEHSSRKTRNASHGVAHLFQEMKAKKKSQVEKGRKKVAVPNEGDHMRKLFVKLERLKPLLKPFNREKYDEISSRVFAKRREFEDAKLDCLSSSVSDLPLGRVNELKYEFFLEEAEREFYKQKVKVDWLCNVDQSTKLFHYFVQVKNRMQTIQTLISAQGDRLDTQELISHEIVQFFIKQLGTRDSQVERASVHLLRELLAYSVSPVDANLLVREFSDEEIKNAMFEQR
ncbi:hypothetical protein V6N13_086849 [Hibiscus sabdariffa]